MLLDIREAEGCLPDNPAAVYKHRNHARRVSFPVWREQAIQTCVDRLRLNAEDEEREYGRELHSQLSYTQEIFQNAHSNMAQYRQLFFIPNRSEARRFDEGIRNSEWSSSHAVRARRRRSLRTTHWFPRHR